MRAELKRIRASLNGVDARAVSRCALVIMVAVMVAVYPPSALADADPASDILLAQNAFYPYQPPVPHALEATMETVLRSAARAGLPLKVAVIGSREDLGAVPEFFGHPQQYAQFLDKEISYNNRPPLLVVMPAGFGVVAAGPPNALAGLKLDTQHSSYGLVRSAILAVVSMVRATGRTIATPSIPPNSSAGGSPGILFAIPAALLVLVGLAALRRRGSRRQEEADASTVEDRAGQLNAAQLKARRAARARALRRRRRVTLAALVVALALAALAGSLVSRRSAGHTAIRATAPSVGAARRPAVARESRMKAQLAAVRRLAAYGLPLFCGGRSKRMVALTFDDGPGPYTRLAIDKLRKHHLRATFFLVGKQIHAYPGLAGLEKTVGVTGDHTMTHPFLPALPRAEMVQEIAGAKALIEHVTAQPVVLFRPPYEGLTPAIEHEARALGMLVVLWNVDSGDSLGANYAGIERNVLAGLHPGSIILMHENRGQTIRALLTISAALARNHLRAVTIPELVAEDPPSLAQLRAGGRGCGVWLQAGNGA
jgi:peptidoglycan-N-acetylglucosamine deacetylase